MKQLYAALLIFQIHMLVRIDWLKYKIKEHTIEYCKKRAKAKRQKEKEIMKELYQNLQP